MKPFINENGWFDKGSFYNNVFTFKYEDLNKSFSHKENYMIPISIRDLENNNGWISINSEDDLPKDYEGKMFWIVNNDHIPKKHFLAFFNGKFFTIEHFPMKTDTITHYQPILPPKPPIF